MKRRRRSGFAPWLAMAVVTGVVVFCGPFDVALRLLNFFTLTKEEVLRGARIYVDERTDGRQAACLYIVSCDDGPARLTLVSNLTPEIMREAKGDIWHRRSSGFCRGRTTNIGLELIPEVGGEPQGGSNGLARWSFFNDRFIPRSGRFQSGSFSDKPWEPCTFEKALIRSRPVATPQTPPPA